ncbi:EscE/YscE/SsaE family type III secretion system needle protein co-chaperone [Vibrio sp. 10N.222.54.F12]|uniref:EscE/YscE/SsaE family type III secretion system needle protein co-chaperone n=1 Tax=Vibrio TaxID=662 RepID=UPI000318CCAA|nr:EscE/YscE/SsaE family type III secretion system needle protein co-chaperone [Vibrio tasmaniensis]OEF72957.1 EscE/YscE/SsaE family type III secretion system needle protein co-chaperone [Vibrio tasmaniensis 1F-187]PML15145.1 EscE/YscE/SsaE family type III secretion system needle protein co-chaperone [Vibrio tasmaniensis]PML45912.1 EscE/YscE/SsaE family type III secretion system needle protein co-chaperone [Vibrio tasmaniensis]
MTNLEQLLQGDSGQQEKEVIIFKFKQAQSAIKRQLHLGCSPKEYQLLHKQHEAYQAALAVIETFLDNK